MHNPSLNSINLVSVPPFGLDVGLGMKTKQFHFKTCKVIYVWKIHTPEGQSSGRGESMPIFFKHKHQGKYLWYSNFFNLFMTWIFHCLTLLSLHTSVCDLSTKWQWHECWANGWKKQGMLTLDFLKMKWNV